LTSAQRLDPKEGTGYALRSVIAVVRNEQEEALKLAAEAVRLAPGSATPYVARSYAEQSAFEIEKAHESLEKAAELAPEDALVWARLAEIELSRGDLDAALEAATRAETLDPALARTQSVLGYAYLTRIEVDRAKTAFERALVLDPADPLPRLGMGLAKIRDGNVDEGTKEIEIAASLDPNNSLIRSYLGKAYYEQKRGGLAETEFEQAKLLDPKDPTPWFYDAIHKQTTNRPVEALHDLQKAIDLNDNRAVYRSRLLLDQDLAARSAALGRIYRDLGFEQRALFEGWRSVNTAPADHSGHRLLADSYSGLRRHEIARVSELLQAQLLQPLNVTPLQPQLAETDLRVLERAGPADPAFNEFNPLFTRDGLTLQASGLVAGNDTYGDELTQSGLWGRFGYSLGQFHYESEGFRDNNDLEHDIYNAFAQFAISSDTSVQVDLRHQGSESGDLIQAFDPKSFSPDQRTHLDRETARFGLHHRPTPNQDLLASFIYRDLTNRLVEPAFFVDELLKTGAYSLEFQYQLHAAPAHLTAGVGHTDRDRTDIFSITDPECEPDDPLCAPEIDDVDAQHTNVYLYTNLEVLQNLSWTFGLAYDRFDGRGPKLDRDRWSPKLGLIWEVLPHTVLRAAWFKTLKRPFVSNQTVEPTQVAGFNQFFDDADGTEGERYGVGIDHRLVPRLYAGGELSWRDISVPIDPGTGEVVSEERDEQLHRAYLYWTPTDTLALSAEYFLERFSRSLPASISVPEDPDSITTHRVPLSISYFYPRGFFARLTASYINQDVESQGVDSDGASGAADFWVLDASLGYRLPRRLGILSVGAKNLLDNEFRFLETSTLFDEEPFVASFQPDQVLFAQFTLSF
ncbi:MAG: TonB-dependent receptor domain-containing protein, partial [Gammaproteobacteria bacterium]